MKKMLSIILCICMLASLSACTTKDTTTNDTTTNEDTTKETLKSLSSFSEPNVNETFDYTGYTNKELYKWGKGIVLPVQNPQNSQAEISTEEGYNIKLTCSNKSDIDKYVNDMKLDDWFCYTNNESGIYSFLKNNMALILTKNRDKNSEFIENKFNLTFIMGKEEESNKEKINTLEEQLKKLGYDFTSENSFIIELPTDKITDRTDIKIFNMVKYETGDDRFQSYACIEENNKIVLLSPYIFSYSSASECRFYDIDSDGIDEFICSSECLDGYDSAKTDSTIRIFKKDKRDIYILDYNYRVRYINLNNTDYDRFYSYLVGDFKDNKICINIGIHDKTSPASAYYNKSKNQWSVMELEKTDMYLTYKDGKYIIENQKDIEIIEESDKMIEY